MPKLVGETSVAPSGRSTETLAELQHDVPIVTPVSFSVTVRPAVPENVLQPLSPGTSRVRVEAGPPSTRVPVGIVGHVVEGQRGRTDRVRLRVDDDAVRAGRRERLRVDEAAARTEVRAERSVVPSGFRIESFAEEQHDEPIVTSVSLRLTRRPAVPLKTKAAFWPGTVVGDRGRGTARGDRRLGVVRHVVELDGRPPTAFACGSTSIR